MVYVTGTCNTIAIVLDDESSPGSRARVDQVGIQWVRWSYLFYSDDKNSFTCAHIHAASTNQPSRNCKLRWKLNNKEDCFIHAPCVFMRKLRDRLGQAVKRTPTQVHERTTIHWTNAQKPLPDGSLSFMMLSQPFCTVDPHIPYYELYLWSVLWGHFVFKDEAFIMTITALKNRLLH